MYSVKTAGQKATALQLRLSIRADRAQRATPTKAAEILARDSILMMCLATKLDWIAMNVWTVLCNMIRRWKQVVLTQKVTCCESRLSGPNPYSPTFQEQDRQ